MTALETLEPGPGPSRRDQVIAARVRATIAMQRRVKTRIAADVWGRSQQWFSLRINGHVPFTAGELVDLADYLGVDVNVWQEGTGPSPSNGQPTVAYVAPHLASSTENGQRATPPRTGHLSLVA